MFGDLKVSPRTDYVLSGKVDYFLVTSGDPPPVLTPDERRPRRPPDDSEGRFWSLAPVRADVLPELLAASLKELRRKAKENGWKTPTEEDAKRALLRYHTGAKRQFLAGTIGAVVEIDHLSVEEQKTRYAALTEATGLRWTLQVFSGKKSIHAYFAFTRLVLPSDPIRVEIQDLLIAILEGDPAIRDLGRLTRLPGWHGRRHQPVLHLDPTARYDPEELRDRLLAYYRALGGVDVAVTVRALKGAKRLTDLAAKTPNPEMSALADRLRASRFAPTASDLDLITRLLADERGEGRAGRSTTRGGYDVWEVASVILVPFAQLVRGTRVDPPCCGTGGSGRGGAGEVASNPGESPRVRCYRCDHVVVAIEDDLPGVEIITGTVLLAPGPKVETKPAPDPEKVRALMASVRATTKAKEVLRDTEGDRLKQAFRRFHPTLEARKLAAQSLDPRRVAACVNVRRLETSWRSRFRRALTSQGLTKPKEGCGVTQLLANAVSGNDVSDYRRLCGKLSCPHCMPWVIGNKAASVALGPVVDRSGRVVGGGLATRETVYLTRMAAPLFNSWKDAYDRTKTANAVFPGTIEGTPSSRERPRKASPYIFAAFHRRGVVTVLSDMPPSTRSRVRPTRVLRGATTIQTAIFRLTVTTYRYESVSLDGGNEKALTGSITSPWSLHLDPEEVVSISKASAWVVLAKHGVKTERALKILATFGVRPKAVSDEDGNISSVTVRDIVGTALSLGLDPADLLTRIVSALTDASVSSSSDYHDDDLSDLDFSVKPGSRQLTDSEQHSIELLLSGSEPVLTQTDEDVPPQEVTR